MRIPIIKLPIIFMLILLFQFGYSQETRETAQLLTEPETFTVEDAPYELWYRYIADSSCTITLLVDLQNPVYFGASEIYLYRDSSAEYCWYNDGVNLGSSSDYINMSNKSEVSTFLEQGDEVYFKVLKWYDASGLIISFNVSANQLGSSFENPLPVSLDSIPMLISTQNNTHSFVYFEFSPQDNMLPYYYFEEFVYNIYQKLSDGSYVNNYLYDQTVYSGETYIFEFPTIYTQDLYWYFWAEPVELGHDCSSPERISVENTTEYITESEWISFLPERDGYYTLTLNDTVNEDMNLIHSPYCFNDPILGIVDDTIESGTYSRYLTAGEERKFNVTGVEPGATYSVTLSYIPELEGDRCHFPIVAALDSFYTQSNPNSYFAFTPPESGYYIVTLRNLFHAYGDIITSVDCSDIYVGYDSFNAWNTNSTQVRVYLLKDSSYIINSNIVYSDSDNSIFSISSYTPIEGETCSDAIEVSDVGSYTVDHPLSDIWLTFTAESSGAMYISTLNSTQNETYLQIFRGDCDNQITENGYYMNTGQSYVEFDVVEGDIIYIKSNQTSWGYYGSYPIEIGYITFYREGYSCDYPLLITDLQETQSTTYSLDATAAFYEIILDSEIEITISDGNSSNFIQLFSDCDTRITSSELGDVTRILPAGEYIVEWINTTGEDINWIITLNDNPDTDNDGTPNASDDDDDNDGVPDSEDQFPYDATESLDTDNDGLGNNIDTDDDGDGLLDFYDPYPLQPVSIDELYNECAGILVQPNPVNDRLEITGLESGLVYSIKIIDSKGTIVLIQNEYIEGTTIDVSGLEASIYTVLIQNEARTFSTTFFKK